MRLVYIFPGIFQIAKRKFVLGGLLFLLLLVAISIFIKVNFFTDYQNMFLEVFAVSLFVLVYVLHLLHLVIYKTAFKKIYSPQGDLYEQGRLAMLKQNYELAILNFESLLKIQNDDEDVMFQLGKAYLENGQKEKSIQFFHRNRKRFSKKWNFEVESILEDIK